MPKRKKNLAGTSASTGPAGNTHAAKETKLHETDEEIKNRILDLCEEGDYGRCSPPIEASTKSQKQLISIWR